MVPERNNDNTATTRPGQQVLDLSINSVQSSGEVLDLRSTSTALDLSSTSKRKLNSLKKNPAAPSLQLV